MDFLPSIVILKFVWTALFGDPGVAGPGSSGLRFATIASRLNPADPYRIIRSSKAPDRALDMAEWLDGVKPEPCGGNKKPGT